MVLKLRNVTPGINMRSCFIDEDGQVLETSNERLASSLGTNLSGAALETYVVKNLGWLFFSQNKHSIRVRCRPSLVTDATLAELFDRLYQAGSPTIAGDFLTTDWNHSIFGSRVKFNRYLSALVDGERKVQRHVNARLLRKSKPPESSKLFKAAHLAQKVLQETRDLHDARPVLDQIFAGRWSMFDVCPTDTTTTTLRALGGGYTPFNPLWLSSSAGQSLKSYGDHNYASWASQHQCEASANERVTFDDVDALVEFPSIGTTRLRYSRVLVPLKLDCDSPVVLSGAVTDGSINLRPYAAHEHL
jgi:hypothetical protein